MKLFAATRADLPAMASAHAQSFDAPWEEGAFAAFLSGPGAYAFVAVDGDPAGVVLCRAIAGEAEVLTLAVSPWARRRGVALALMTAAIGAAGAAGARAMLLEVDVTNAPAVALYERLGFVLVGVRKAYYNRGADGRADAQVMRLDLT
jgi:[ribosomal protein S18]-alanine N-acetyltransferase